MLSRRRFTRRSSEVRIVAAACVIAVAMFVAHFYLGWPSFRSHGQCQSLYFDEATAAAALAAIGGSASEATAMPKELDLGFDGHEAICANALPTATELLNVTADAAAAATANISSVAGAGRALHVQLRYRTCCTGGQKRRPCASGQRPLRLPAAAAQAALASGERAFARPSSSLSSRNLVDALVFVTAASADHFDESLALLRSVQRHFRSEARIVYWDLGLREDQAAVVTAACGVEYRRFDFSKYPPHVAALRTYAFKPLAIMETFAVGYMAIWWVDASIRFTSPCVEHVLELAKERHGLVLFREPMHSVWSTTYPQMFDYIATNEEELKRTVTAPGTTFIVVNTRELFTTVLFWFYACALDERCIAPVANPGECRFAWNGFGDAAWLGGGHFAGCHRFDQSLLTILAANVWGFDSDGYRYRQREFNIERWPDGHSGVQQCSSRKNATAPRQQLSSLS